MTSTVADAIANGLVSVGVDTVFCVPGAHIDDLCHGINSHPALRLVVCRTEAGSAMMAIGHARISGTVACCLAIPGPGLLDLGTSLAIARAVGTPLLCITGTIDSRFEGLGLGLLHETPQVFRNAPELVGATRRLSAEDNASAEIASLVAAARVPPHLPALLEVPLDVAAAEAATETQTRAVTTPTDMPVDPSFASALLKQAVRPLVVAGGGARGASDAILQLAAALDAPVVATVNGRTPKLETSPRVLPPTALAPLWAASDLVMAVGTRLATIYSAERHLNQPRPVIRIDADPSRTSPSERVTMGLCGDANVALQALASADYRPALSGWDRNGLETLRVRCIGAFEAVHPQAAFTRAIDRVLADDAVVALDSTQVAYHVMYALPLRRNRTFLTSGQQGALGSGLPLGIGAKIAAPHRQVLAIIGDGGLVTICGELATLAKEDVGVVIVLVNDEAYSEVALSSRHADADDYSRLTNPDFVSLGSAFGLRTSRVATPDGLEITLERELALGGRSLIEVQVRGWEHLRGIFKVGDYAGGS